jgi:glucoamylase
VIASAIVRWTTDDWRTAHDTRTADPGATIHVADLPVNDLPAGAFLRFTFYWPAAGRREGKDFAVLVA